MLHGISPLSVRLDAWYLIRCPGKNLVVGLAAFVEMGKLLS